MVARGETPIAGLPRARMAIDGSCAHDHTSHMKRTASVVDVKARLSEYLRVVKAGGQLLITERGVPIARMVPLEDAERKSTRRLRLASAGVLKTGRGRTPKLLQTPPSGDPIGASVLDALLAERASDR